MTIDLPPRRKLPAEIKERMRPDFAEARPSRNHTPLAVAAGVALLVAGGVTFTQSFVDRADPGNARVVAPSLQDLNRCRAALKDENWPSTQMVVFDGRKVLRGKDNRFCELTRSRARVVPPNAAPVQLEAGSVTFSSKNITAGVPPLGARTARVREAKNGYSRASTDAVVTPDFFVTYSATPLSITEVVFEDRTVPVPPSAELPGAESADSFESGDDSPSAPVNLLARCADNAATEGTRSDELQGWQPLLANGSADKTGLLLAHRANREWATCFFSPGPGNSGALHQISTAPPDLQGAKMVGGYAGDGAFVLAVRTNRTATTVEVSADGGPPVTADVVDGFFMVTLPGDGARISFDTVHVTARNADKQIVYTGGVT
ncbi:hypothetical protein UK23_15570 [Lentzea aerocolonigenes]|uniref:Uncharacterized protein n=1 Tax=Lentzea aerocolonigenes TaxID=68170 RepID=A0A0F0GZQ6_LENAE|nr:hypothetical protein [Lentzea aerocolonigenes]KJK48934.1 hypothetical protein UK23_15570 [Lentzea aerocolonigenes]